MIEKNLVFITYPNDWNPDTGAIKIERLNPDTHKYEFVADLTLYLNEVNHSPDGFGWGYYGSGPSQTAYAILRYVCGNKTTAIAFYQRLKHDVIANLHGRWELSLEFIDSWLKKMEQELIDKAKKEQE